MTRLISILALLAGCAQDGFTDSPPDLANASPSALSSAAEALTVDALSRVDVRGTATSIAMIAAQVDGLSAEERAQATESLRVLSANCPYTRSAMQLPFALHAVVMGIPAEGLDPFVQRDWATLQEGLSAHVAVLEALGVDLPEPAAGDHLYGREEGLAISLGRLRAEADPIVATTALIEAIPALAKQVDEPTAALITLHSDRVEQATGIGRPCPRDPWAAFAGQPWTLGMQLGGWHDALRRVEPFVDDPEAKRQIVGMIAALDAYARASAA